MGGVLCLRDKGMFTGRYDGIGLRLKEQQILSYGNDSYGGSKYLKSINCLICTFNLSHAYVAMLKRARKGVRVRAEQLYIIFVFSKLTTGF